MKRFLIICKDKLIFSETMSNAYSFAIQNNSEIIYEISDLPDEHYYKGFIILRIITIESLKK